MSAAEKVVAHASQAERYLDVAAARDKLSELGFETTPRQVQGWAERRSLPFFKGPDRKLYIAERELVLHFQRLQIEAGRKTASATAPRSARRSAR